MLEYRIDTGGHFFIWMRRYKSLFNIAFKHVGGVVIEVFIGLILMCLRVCGRSLLLIGRKI